MKLTRFLKHVATPVSLLALVALSGCQQTPSASPAATPATATGAEVKADAKALATSAKALQNAANTSWVLDQWTSADGTTHLPALITLRLGENGRATGSSGENAYFGTAVLEADGSINWGRALAATRIMGSPETIKREAAYVADLKATKQADLKKNRLILTGDNALRLEFVPAPKE
ncbi:META domain-containing protein [Geminisphaera colitermitum]|uniref:META domain-containing protein n=1 Tax=Geminisphaera colitermitum TaxID=1148786 RepID=UPI000158D181|nr:META domain-containing protein [Geminisphaera colitermitum]